MSLSALNLDFSWKVLRSAHVVGIVLLCISTVCAGVVVWRYEELRTEVDELAARTDRLQRRKSGGSPVPAETPERMEGELQLARRVIEELDRPWGNVLRAVESAVSDNATLLSVEPEPERAEIRLQAEARDFGSMLEFVRQLGQQAYLRNVHLASHQINGQDAQRPVRFTVLAGWATTPIPLALPEAEKRQ